MPLPFIAAAIAALGTLSVTSIVVGGLITLGVIGSIGALIDTIENKKRELGATEARITSLYRSGNYAKLKIGLRDRSRSLGTIECEAKDSNHELYEGMYL